MSPLDARLLTLVAELRRDWAQVAANRDRALGTDPGAGDPEAALVALSLDHAYQAFETMLVRIEQALGLPARAGAEWHSALLFDAASDVPGLRPVVCPPSTLRDWEAILKFRHFLRHAYAVSLDADQLRANGERLARAVNATGVAIENLIAMIERP